MGGENTGARRRPPIRRGSSPRGRGKRRALRKLEAMGRLIPAWAGKTLTRHRERQSFRAHPRVGGENRMSRVTSLAAPGSSPRGRGKRERCHRSETSVGLIPAWAGKTSEAIRRSCLIWAHPRVGGENLISVSRAPSGRGSSPRGRGKHFLTCAFIERIGQILETLELAVSSESYTLSAAYATDAPQDQARNTALVLPSSRGAS